MTGIGPLLAGFSAVKTGSNAPFPVNKEGLTMPEDKSFNERDAKLVQWLSEAHAKESELEADLTAHIALTEKPPYKKRLQQHLKETREHKRSVARRIKSLGGQPAGGAHFPGVPTVVGAVAGQTVRHGHGARPRG